MGGWGVSAATGFFLFIVPVAAGPLQEAIVNRDVLKLEKLGTEAAATDEGRLATGAALSLRHKDEAAQSILEPLSRARTEIGAAACLALADIYLREGRYADLRTALLCAGPLNPETRQVLDYANVLAAEKPMRLVNPAKGRLDVRHDKAGLIRLEVEINGQPKSAVIDTDASFCVLAESEARQLGVRVLDTPVSIITTARVDQPMRLGVADEVRLGDAVLTNVVFAVLPDAALRFGPSYRMNIVVGLPVVVSLGRIELVQDEGGETLYYGPRTSAPSERAPNMALSGLDPFAVLLEARTGAMLRLAIDSAAQTTTLNGAAIREYPALGEGSVRGFAEWQGAGGSQSDRKARVMPELRLTAGERTIALKRVNILSADEHDRHGAIGQDFLKQGHGWAIDFEAMRFTIVD